MISFFPIAVAVLINGLFVGLRISLESVLVATISVLCVTAAMATRRYFLMVSATAISGVGYLSLMLSGSQSVRVWLAVLFGSLAFLLLETGYDAIVCVRAGVTWSSYRHRIRHISMVLLVSIILAIVFITISFNLSVHLPGFPGSRLLYPALYILGAVPAAALGIAVKGRRDGRRQSRESDDL